MSNTATLNSPDGLTISRIKPMILSDHMSDIQWNTFCEEIDRALAPASELKKLSKWMMMIRLFSWLFFGVLIVLLVLSWGSNSVRFSGTWYWILIIAMIVIEFGARWYIAKRFQAASRQVMSGLGEVCNRYSTSNPDLEFKVIENDDSAEQVRSAWGGRRLFKAQGDIQRDYIEITVTSTAGNTIEPPVAIATSISSPSEPPIVQAFVEPSAPPSTDLEMGSLSTNKTSITTRREQRMAELDAMKDRISEDEYYAKRAEILSDV